MEKNGNSKELYLPSVQWVDNNTTETGYRESTVYTGLPANGDRPQLNSAYQLPPVTSILTKESSACDQIDMFQERGGILPPWVHTKYIYLQYLYTLARGRWIPLATLSIRKGTLTGSLQLWTKENYHCTPMEISTAAFTAIFFLHRRTACNVVRLTLHCWTMQWLQKKVPWRTDTLSRVINGLCGIFYLQETMRLLWLEHFGSKYFLRLPFTIYGDFIVGFIAKLTKDSSACLMNLRLADKD